MDKAKVVTGLVIIAAIALLTGGVIMLKSKPAPTPEISATPTTTSEIAMTPQYKDGTYTEDGSYQSPGGPESITVTVTLQGGKIVDSEVISNGVLPNTKLFQGKFISGYKEFVTGKNIGEVKLDKVSGSSLTPKGFNDALDKIKADARS